MSQESNMTRKSLGRNALYNIIYKVLSIIFPLISTAYVSRVLFADGIGRVNAVSNNVSYFLIFASLGIPTYGLREIAKRRDETPKRDKLFCELFSINALLTLFTYLVFNYLVFRSRIFAQEKTLYIIYGFTILLNVFNVDWLFQALEEYGYIAIRSSIVKIMSLIALFLLVKNKNDIYIYAAIQVIATTGNYLFNIYTSKHLINWGFDDLELKKHIKSLIYMALGGVSAELYAKMDITMLDIYKGNNVVGYYTSSQKIINLIITALVAITSVFLPRLSYLFGKDKKEFSKVIEMGAGLMITVSIPACVGLIFISKPLVVFFLGKTFSESAVTLAILSFMIPLKCIGDIVGYQVMICAKKEDFLMKCYFGTMVINLINNLLLIPKYSAVGASIASVISEFLTFIFVLSYSRKYFKLKGIRVIVNKTVFATFVMFIAMYGFSFVKANNVLKLLGDLLCALIAFILSGIIMKHDVITFYVAFLKQKMKLFKYGGKNSE